MGLFYVPIRRLVYLTAGALDRLVPLKTNIFILCYHSIDNAGWDFSVRPEEFKKQINYLADSYKFISLADLSAYLENKKATDEPSVAITFDDGYKDILCIKSFLQSKNIKPTVFVFSDKKNVSRKELDTDKEFLAVDEIRELISAGWEVGCHTATHSDMRTLNSDQINDEVVKSKQNLEKELGIPVKYIAYPKGRYNSKVLDAVKKAGYKLGLTMDDMRINRETDPLKVPRIGVDGTHSFNEFKVIMLPLVSGVRKLMKSF